MPFVKRDGNGNIIGIFSEIQPGVAEEFVANPVLYLGDPLSMDQEVLNATLIEEGSIVRALALVMFEEVNKLRVKTGDPAYTLNQFRNALKAKMRT